MTIQSFLHTTNDQLITLGDRAYSPYSELKQSCIFLFPDGQWIPGVRVENASYPLTITAFQNAWSTSLLASNVDPIAIVFAEALEATESQIILSIFPRLEVVNDSSEAGILFLEKGRDELPDLANGPMMPMSGKVGTENETDLMELCN